MPDSDSKNHLSEQHRGAHMKESRVASIAAVALIASGFMFAQSSNPGTMDSQIGSSTASAPQTSGHTDVSGDLPASKEGEAQSGKASQSSPKSETPGTMSAPEMPSQGTTPKGETPATGVQTGQQGSASSDSSARPGTDPSATPASSNPNSADTPSYAKPITRRPASSTTPSQQSTDPGTASPK